MKTPNTNRAQKIEEEVAKTLEAKHHVDSDPFFYSKLIARMEREAEPSPGWEALAWLRPVAFAAFFLVSATVSLQVIFNSPVPSGLADQSDLYEQLASDHFLEETNTNDNWYY